MALIENEQIQDLVIPDIEKKKFRINGDNSRILELNPSDVNILQRLSVGYNDLLELADKVTALNIPTEGESEEQLKEMADQLSAIDQQMREKVDYIFDANVSEVCAGASSMYDPMNGKFRWEHIIEAIGRLYGTSFKKEFDQLSKRVAKHTAKYTNDHNKSTKATKKKA